MCADTERLLINQYSSWSVETKCKYSEINSRLPSQHLEISYGMIHTGKTQFKCNNLHLITATAIGEGLKSNQVGWIFLVYRSGALSWY